MVLIIVIVWFFVQIVNYYSMIWLEDSSTTANKGKRVNTRCNKCQKYFVLIVPM